MSYHICICCTLCLLRATFSYFFFNDTATTEIYTLSLHDALPICQPAMVRPPDTLSTCPVMKAASSLEKNRMAPGRSEEHTSELQSRQYLVCRLLLEKKKKKNKPHL